MWVINQNKSQNTSGQSAFTIVELLIVVVVIAILATIATVAYGGIQSRARNTVSLTELKAWQNTFELYKSQYGAYPAMSDGGYCLGYGFPVGGGGVARCADYTLTSSNSYIESNNASLMTELVKVGSLPNSSKQAVTASVGPYVEYYPTEIMLFAVMQGTTCPDSTVSAWQENSTVWCTITLIK